MHTKKSKGPRIEPCGIPLKIGGHDEDLPLRTTLWNLLLSKLCNVLYVIHVKFQLFQICITILFARLSQTFSNFPRLSQAFEISKKLALTSNDGL